MNRPRPPRAQILLRILKGEVHAVIRGLRRMATVQKLFEEKRADVDSACGYFTARVHRMKYDEYLAAGLPIATGMIEGACRHLVKDRLERTGMRSSTEGAQAMLSLRSLLRKSGGYMLTLVIQLHHLRRLLCRSLVGETPSAGCCRRQQRYHQLLPCHPPV